MTSSRLTRDELPAKDVEQLLALRRSFRSLWQRNAERAFGTPGRIEIVGNHTDHNFGKVIAAAIDLNTHAAVAPRRDNIVRIHSQEMQREFRIDLDAESTDRTALDTTELLVHGVAAELKRGGYRTGGFDAFVASKVEIGSGLSSSAAFEVLVGVMFSHLYNDARVSLYELAKVAQRAENIYVGKPSGLMDQIACAYGGAVAIDFAEGLAEVTPLELKTAPWLPVILMTRENHEHLTRYYGEIPEEMKAVAGFCGATVLREVDEAQFRQKIPAIREALGDRACLRAMHFFEENTRVDAVRCALQEKNMSAFLAQIRSSSYSSWCLLQNVSTYKDPASQEIATALAASESFFRGLPEKLRGACRIHGGGFAGSILAFVHEDSVEAYQRTMEPLFGEGSLRILSPQRYGCAEIVL